MSAKYSFRLTSEIKTHPLPAKILINQHPLESANDVILKLLARVIFSRDRLQLEPRLHDDNIPFVPSLVQLNYELRPALWIEVGDCPVQKLDKLAVKANEAKIWVLLHSESAIKVKLSEMSKLGLRKNRYTLMAFEDSFLKEMVSLLSPSNSLGLLHLNTRDLSAQIEFNELWFDVRWAVKKH